MRQAHALAAIAEGTTSPNPRVGCVLVRDGEVVGAGYHRSPGTAHAEAAALEQAGGRAAGATAYVNLEPCAHHGRTPPCADHRIAAGVRRVVASMVDPNPRVDGRGFDRLRDAGVEVEVGLLEAEARRLNEAFCFAHERGRPLVTLKAGASLDGMLSAREGRSRWITGPLARAFAHRLRMRHDAVLVGAATARIDDPSLTVRLPGVSAERLRVVLAPRLDLDPTARLFSGGDPGKVLLYAGEQAAERGRERFAGRATVIGLPEREDGLDLARVLGDLHRRQVLSVLVEGGGATLSRFLAAGLADRMALFQASLLIGSGGGTPLLDGPAVAQPADGWRLRDLRRIPLGPDLLTLGRLRRATAGEEESCSPD